MHTRVSAKENAESETLRMSSFNLAAKDDGVSSVDGVLSMGVIYSISLNAIPGYETMMFGSAANILHLVGYLMTTEV